MISVVALGEGTVPWAKMRQEIIYSIETMEVRIELNMVLSRRCKCEKILWIWERQIEEITSHLGILYVCVCLVPLDNYGVVRSQRKVVNFKVFERDKIPSYLCAHY